MKVNVKEEEKENDQRNTRGPRNVQDNGHGDCMADLPRPYILFPAVGLLFLMANSTILPHGTCIRRKATLCTYVKLMVS